MSVIRKLIILIIFVIFSFILYRLMATRRAIKAEYGIEGFREGALFSSPTMDGELATVKTTDVPASTTDATNATLPLKQYCIKGAFNAALTGKFVNTEMIKYVLYRGCRFLDFEVFSFDGDPYVAMSTDNTYSTIDTTNKITLQDAISTATTYGFVAPSPINHDPLFVHLRVKTNNTKLYDKMADVIRKTLRPPFDASGNPVRGYKMYADPSGNALPVNGNTILSDIRDKIIIVLDKTYVPTYIYDSPNLVKCVNMESGYDVLRKYGYSDLSKQQYTSPFVYADGMSTDVYIMKMVMPDMGVGWTSLSRNSVYYPMVLNYGAQVVLYPFYQVDQYLGDYERAFASGKSGFVPMGTMVTYLKSTVGGDSSVAVRPTDISGAAVNPFASQQDVSLDTKQDRNEQDLENVKRNLKDMVSSVFT